MGRGSRVVTLTAQFYHWPEAVAENNGLQFAYRNNVLDRCTLRRIAESTGNPYPSNDFVPAYFHDSKGDQSKLLMTPSLRYQEDLMNQRSLSPILVCIALLVSSLPSSAQSWRSHLNDEMPLMGHRNWILIVDSAYPEQVGFGIETIETNSDQLDVVHTVLAGIKDSIHVRPVIFMDVELPFVSEQKAPGISNYRSQISTLLRGYEVNSRLHQSLIDEVGKDSAQYRVLILKTKLAIPYTSVFIHLDCKYWGAEDERDLREAIHSHSVK
jgi:hypothetical protein